MTSPASTSAVVFVIDDDEGIRDALSLVLEDCGLPCATAPNGAEALEWLEANPAPGVILLDLQMPVMDGYTFRARQQLHPRLADIPVIIITASRANNDRIQALGAQGLMVKPFDLDRMVGAIRQLIQGNAADVPSG